MRGFINAKLYNRKETAFLVDDDGCFAAFGTNGDILAQLEENEESVDLKDAYVVPGFMDAGTSLLSSGYANNTMVHLDKAHSLEEILSRIRGTLYNGKPKEWILATGYAQENMEKGILPNRQILDTVSREYPIVLMHKNAKEMIVNSKALEKAQIEEDSYVEGGYIDYQSGILKESACAILREAMPKASEEEITKAILEACKSYNRMGITAVGSSDFACLPADYKTVMDAFMKLSYQGKLTVRVVEQCEFTKPEDFAEFLDEGYTTGVGDDFFEIGPLKIVTDGILDIHTASLTKPYDDEGTHNGISVYNKEELRTLLALAFEYNMPAILEAHGDKAVKEALSVYSGIALEKNPLGYGFMHAQCLDSKTLQEMEAQNLDYYYKPENDKAMALKRLGKQRYAKIVPIKTIFEHTNLATCGVSPLKGIEILTNRENALSREEAIACYTENGAKALRMNIPTGLLKEEYKADFTVLDTDLSECENSEIADSKVFMCVVDGNTVFER